MPLYITTAELTDYFLGRFTLGTSDDDMCAVGQGTRIIGACSAMIDYELSERYGTYDPLFGTNSIGSMAIPEMVKFITAELSCGMIFKNAMLTVSEKQSAWAQSVYDTGTQQLFELQKGLKSISYAGTTESPAAAVGGGYTQVRGEVFTFSGTNAVDLEHYSILKNSVRVYGTDMLSPVEFTINKHFFAWFYDDELAGTYAGKLAHSGTTGFATGTLGTAQTVFVDYKYYTESVFHLNDFNKWGETNKERRG